MTSNAFALEVDFHGRKIGAIVNAFDSRVSALRAIDTIPDAMYPPGERGNSSLTLSGKGKHGVLSFTAFSSVASLIIDSDVAFDEIERVLIDTLDAVGAVVLLFGYHDGTGVKIFNPAGNNLVRSAFDINEGHFATSPQPFDWPAFWRQLDDVIGASDMTSVD